jgi:hypothetical protein
MSSTDLPGIGKLLFATCIAALFPVFIHSFFYLSTIFFPSIIPFFLKNTYSIAIFAVLPAYLLLRKINMLNAWTVVAVAGAAGLSLGIFSFIDNDWGTGGFTTYGEGNYRTVENGKLTNAGIVFVLIQMTYFTILGTFSGLVVWFLIQRKRFVQ